MSADPVAGRLPYAIITKVVSILGWKRFEVDETMMFEGIKDAARRAMEKFQTEALLVRR